MATNDVPEGTKIESVRKKRRIFYNSYSTQRPLCIFAEPKLSITKPSNVSLKTEVLFEKKADGSPEATKITVVAGETAKETAAPPIKTRWRRCEVDQTKTIWVALSKGSRILHQSTLYRSYYKYWKETVDQVMTTAKIRGMDDGESSGDAPGSSRRRSLDRKDDMSAPAAPAAVTPMSNRIDPRTTDALGRDTAEVPTALSNDQSKVVEPFTGVVTAETVAESTIAKRISASQRHNKSAKIILLLLLAKFFKPLDSRRR
ncbi:hypothetical protein PUN28_019336 [Cardiocondyla obscurior]|uniref:Uncharacterized protein n=1 Tax=Cardiocondyla obscurior TaxID=286306 RepID=A0AAW2EF45_9HYME